MHKVEYLVRYVSITASVIALTLMINACAQYPDYYVGFVNKTGHDLDRVSAYYGNDSNRIWVLPMWMVAHGRKEEGPIPLPIPKEAQVRVVDKGVEKSVIISLSSVPKRGFEDGTIYIIINTNDTVEAKPVKSGDNAATAKVMEGLRPKGEYRLGFVDKTGRDLEDILVNAGGAELGRLSLPGGDLPARVKVGYSDPLLPPIPTEVELRWKQDGAPHTVEVKLDDVPKEFEGRIFFVIKADGTVEVHPVKNGDDKTAFQVVK
jgi:hypothetical protein